MTQTTNEGKRLIAEGVLDRLDGAVVSLFDKNGRDLSSLGYLERAKWSFVVEGEFATFSHEPLVWEFDSQRPDVHGWRISRGATMFSEQFDEPKRIRQKGDIIRFRPVVRVKLICEG